MTEGATVKEVKSEPEKIIETPWGALIIYLEQGKIYISFRTKARTNPDITISSIDDFDYLTYELFEKVVELIEQQIIVAVGQGYPQPLVILHFVDFLANSMELQYCMVQTRLIKPETYIQNEA